MPRMRASAATNARSARRAPTRWADAARIAAASSSRDRVAPLARSTRRRVESARGRHRTKSESAMLNDPIVIVGAARTPMGGFQGDFAALAASDLGAAAIKAAVERAKLAPADVEEVIMGNVLPAGQGQAPARQASIKAGLPLATGCTTVNKMCGSAMEAAILAHDALATGSSEVIVAGGMESMTNAPYLMPKARAGYRMGHQTVYDHMFLDGLEDAYDKGRLMGTFAEDCASTFGFTREAQDQFALTSLSRALAANNDGTFGWETTPVTVPGRKGDVVIARDEQPAKAA